MAYDAYAILSNAESCVIDTFLPWFDDEYDDHRDPDEDDIIGPNEYDDNSDFASALLFPLLFGLI